MEVENLSKEFIWFLENDVYKSLDGLRYLIKECGKKYPLAIWGNEELARCDKYILTSENLDHLECSLIIMGDNIHQADVVFKYIQSNNNPSLQNPLPFKLNIQPDSPWKLQQVQDSANYLYLAFDYLQNILAQKGIKQNLYRVARIIDDLNVFIIRGRNCLTMPPRRTFDEIANSQTMKILETSLPKNTSISVYLNGPKLIFAVYTMSRPGDFDLFQAECQIDWIKDILVYYNKILELLSHLSDKVAMFGDALNKCGQINI